MGSGKTRWGRALAQNLGCPFIDLDAEIQEKERKSIPEIFAESGESGFRELEQKYLRDLADFPPSIVATGGGTPCFFGNMDWMKKNGTTVYLKTPPEILLERLKNARAQRPLLSNVGKGELRAFIQNRLQEREPVYLQADFTLEHTSDDAAFLGHLMAFMDK